MGLFDFGRKKTETDDDAQKIFHLYRTAKAARQKYEDEWDEYLDYYAGRHGEEKLQRWQIKMNVNLCWSKTETLLPIMTGGRPILEAVPVEDSDQVIANVINKLIQRIWMLRNGNLKLTLVVKDSLICGTSFIEVGWDASLRNGLGDVTLTPVDFRTIYPDPNATSMEDAEYIVRRAQVSMLFLRQRFGAEAIADITPGVWDESFKRDITKQSSSASYEPTVNLEDTTGGRVWKLENKSPEPLPESSLAGRTATLMTLYRRTSNGITRTCAVNSKILERDVPAIHKEVFPIVRFVDNPVLGSFWALGELQNILPLQKSINERRRQIHDILEHTGNPIMKIVKGKGIPFNKIFNIPGMKVEVEDPNDITWLQPAALPGAIFAAEQEDMRTVDVITGVSDVTEGRRPTGIQAAAAIQSLYEFGSIRIQKKIQLMEESLRDVGRLMLAYIQANYTTRQVFRITEPNSGTEEVVTINDVQYAGGVEQRLNDVTTGEYDIEMVAGSTLPQSRSAKFQQAMDLYLKKALDLEGVLRAAVHAGVVSRVDADRTLGQYKAQEAQQQMAAAQQVPPGVPQGAPPQEELIPTVNP